MSKDSDGYVRAIARGFSVIEALGRPPGDTRSRRPLKRRVDGELDPAVCGIAVPLRDPPGSAVAALSVNTISGTISEAGARKKFLVPLGRTAHEIRSHMTSGIV
jgi:hypothetical protein